MATTSQDTQSCSVCRRHFLPGEAVKLYRDPGSTGFQRVCPLCGGAALRRGWQACEATREEPLRVPADPARYEANERRDRLVERLQAQLENVEHELATVRGSLTATERRAAELEDTRVQLGDARAILSERERELQEALRHREDMARDVDRLSQSLAQAAVRDRRLERAEKRTKEMEAELVELAADRDRMARVRRRESDAAYLRGVAAQALNRSEQAGVVSAASRALGAPRCRLAVEGVGLPRQVRASFVWDRAWLELMVSLDLAERSVSVHEVGRGDDPRQLPAAHVTPNASWTPGNGLIADV